MNHARNFYVDPSTPAGDWDVSRNQVGPGNMLPDAGGTPELSLSQKLFSEGDSVHLVWMLKIDGELRELVKPLAIKVRRESNWYAAECDRIDVLGHGSTKEEALRDAIEDISHLYSYYRSLSRDRLIGRGVSIKERFEQLF